MNRDLPHAPAADAACGANRLARETSPYLRQHAHNPVDWYPWGDEAFGRAHAEDRPILLSVGYSACHWCHVMERESFENAAIAAVMNANYVCVKVDREERPDIDEIYMAAVQAMTGSGGWPMTVFLTPDLRPFYGGTYFPPDDRYGRPGFGRVLQAVASHYRERRDRVEDQAAKLREFLAQNADPLAAGASLRAEWIAAAARQLVDAHDDRFGGFSPHGPKFPNSAGLTLLLRHWHDSGDGTALAAAVHTLERMARGGVYDHLGGGFHRYSVDERWLVPHFEKMLYDNALLVPVYLEAFQATGRQGFGQVARESLDYALREMAAPGGGYCATQDADSEGEEGRFFVWTPEQVEAVLGAGEAADLFCRCYGVTPHGNLEGSGSSVLHVEAPIEEAAAQLGVPAQDLRRSLDESRRALFAARAERVPPGRDDKVLVSWNGLMISAMARGYQVLGDERYLRSAEGVARFLLESLVVEGSLRHGYKDGQAPIDAFQDDYACLANGLVDLYESTFEPEWLRRAADLAHEMVRRFWDDDGPGGFFFADASRRDLVVRSKNPFDGATPSGNSVAVTACLRLAILTGDDRLHSCAQRTLAAYAGLMERSPGACPFMLCGLHRLLRGACEVTVVGPEAARRAFLERVHGRYLPNRVLAGAGPNGQAPAVASLVPALRERVSAADGGARAYVCLDSVCSAPAADADGLARLLQPLVREPVR